jgi:hypothetical protein
MRDFTHISNEDKISIINGRIRNLEWNLYNLEAGLVEENARENIISENVTNITNEILETKRCIEALEVELNSLI